MGFLVRLVGDFFLVWLCGGAFGGVLGCCILLGLFGWAFVWWGFLAGLFFKGLLMIVLGGAFRWDFLVGRFGGLFGAACW